MSNMQAVEQMDALCSSNLVEPRAQHVVYKDMFLLEHTKDASVRNCHFIRFAVA